MDQLINMGFSPELAAQALAATGPNSSLQQAADWILSHNHNHNHSSPPKSTTTTQPSLDRFFAIKPSQSPSSQSPQKSTPERKRQKITTPSPPPPPPPLSDRMRPSSLSQILGQDHLRHLLSTPNHLPSLILWGPPGSGKTSTARALSRSLPSSYKFISLSAVSASVSDLRTAISSARLCRSSHRTILFVDEIHRFNKVQLDSFLPAIEDGSIVLIGATTENPSFHLTTPLLSRSRVLSLQPLKPQHVQTLIKRAVDDVDNGLQVTTKMPVSVDEDAIEFLSLHCDGDARVALNSLEVASTLALNRHSDKISVEDAKEAMQCKHLAYDKDGEEHYNLISALHKSMRGNDANAAIYWLARMLEGGEQPLYIARRLVRFASEDVGLADPSALGQAVACYQACHFLGMPECDVCLAQCVAYLATARKSVAVYKALGEARRVVRESKGGNEGVPLHLRNAPTKLMKDVGYGKGYVYTPDDPEGSKSQTYLPPSLHGRKFLDWPPPPPDEQWPL